MVSENIRTFRLEKGLTQKEMAEKFGVRQGKISTWETGFIEPNIAEIIDLAAFFDISIDELLGVDTVAAAPMSGAVRRLTDEKTEIQTLFDAMTERQQVSLLGFAHGLLTEGGSDVNALIHKRRA